MSVEVVALFHASPKTSHQIRDSSARALEDKRVVDLPNKFRTCWSIASIAIQSDDRLVDDVRRRTLDWEVEPFLFDFVAVPEEDADSAEGVPECFRFGDLFEDAADPGCVAGVLISVGAVDRFELREGEAKLRDLLHDPVVDPSEPPSVVAPEDVDFGRAAGGVPLRVLFAEAEEVSAILVMYIPPLLEGLDQDLVFGFVGENP